MQLAPRILIFRLSSMGDVILSTAALDAIRARAPGAKITWVVSKEFAALLEGDPRIERLIAFDRKKEGFRGWHRLMRGLLAASQFDEVLDLHASLRTRYAKLLFWFYRRLGVASSSTLWRTLGKPRLLRLGYFVFKRAWPRALRPGVSGGYSARVSRFASWGDAQGQRAVPDLSWILKRPSKVPESGPGNIRICVMPGAAWKGKCLPTSKWVRVMSTVSASFGQVQWVILGKPREKACEDLERVARGVGIEPYSAFRHLDLLDQAQVVGGSTLLMGNDTGMIHLAEALRVPVVALFGPTQPDLGFGPWRKQSHSVTSPLWCSPCSKDGRVCFRLGKSRFQCQQGISDREISITVQKLISELLEKGLSPERASLNGPRLDLWLVHVYRSVTALLSSWVRLVISLQRNARWNWRDEKWGILSTERASHLPLIWLHAASAGELEMLWPIAEELKRKQFHLGLSVFSSSGMKGVERFREEFTPVYAGPSPWEGEWAEFFETRMRGRFPHAMVTSKYEAWPELWGTLAQKNIPLFVINADERKSLRLAGRWVARIFGVGPRIRFSTVDHDARMRLEASELRRWMADSVQVLGDPRWDRVSSRMTQGSGRAAEILKQADVLSVKRPWIVVGSSWIEDLEFLVPEWRLLSTQRGGGLLWVVPHTVRGASFDRQLRFLEQEFPGRILRSSEWRGTEVHEPQVILVDEMGILVELYAHADAAWVGGGFNTGLHSVIEPALAGVPMGCGPRKSQSFPEVSALVATGQLRVIEQKDELRDWIKTIGASRTGERSVWSEAYQLGAGRRCGQWILEGLNPS